MRSVSMLASFSPRLNIVSPVPECGKSTLLEVIEAFCWVRGAEIVSSTTPASYFRSVHQASIGGGQPPIMLLDERDSFLNAESRKDAFSILNSGHKRKGARVSRCDLSGSGGSYEANSYVTWAPCAFAGIGGFGNTHQANALASRCININLKRKREDEHVERLDRAAEERCVKLGEEAAAWFQENVERLIDEYPEVPAGIYNREADSWRQLFKFADAAGGRWPDLARSAALGLRHGVTDDPGESQMLLADIRDAFEKSGARKLTTSSLIDALHDRVERPWGRKSVTDAVPAFQERQLAALLRPYGITSKNIRVSAAEIRKGFDREQFEDAWSRYLGREEEDVACPEAA